MAFVPVPNTAEVEIVGTLFGQVVENTLYFLLDEPWIESGLVQLAGSVADWFVTTMLPQLSYSYHYMHTQAKDISTPSGLFATNTLNTGDVGGIVEDAAPGNVTCAVSFRTNQSGRSYRGRNFICGIPGVELVGNQVVPAFIDPIVAAYGDLQEAVVDDLPNAQWVVVSRYAGGAPRATGVATPVTAVVLTNYDTDSQRRRLAGRGQ